MSRALEEIRRMQARMYGFMRTYASRSSHQHQTRDRTHKGRPICDVCGEIGHVRQQCFHRFQQNASYCQQQTIPNRVMTEEEPRISALLRISAFEQEAPSRNQPSNDQNSQKEQTEQVYYTRRSHSIPPTPVSTKVPTISTIDAIAVSSPAAKNENEKRPSEIKTDLDAIFEQHAEAAPTKALRIEICTTNRHIDMKATTVMPILTDENLANETLTSPENTNANPIAKEKVCHDSAQIKCSLKPAGTLDSLQKQKRKENDQPSTNSSSLTSKREQRNALLTAKILGCPVDPKLIQESLPQ